MRSKGSRRVGGLNKMYISEKVIEREFSGKNMKEAYLKCCKWVSTNIIAVNNSENITYSIQKKKTQDTYVVVLRVYVLQMNRKQKKSIVTYAKK